MQIYYHISEDNHLREIVQENANFAEGQIAPQIPTYCYGEDKTPRVCFSPHIWQCILSKPIRKGVNKLYIYEINIDSLTDPVGLVADIDSTNEKWLTNKDLQKYGPIKLNKIGKVIVDNNLERHLKILFKQGKLKDIVDEKDSIWGIDEDNWRLIMEI